jgi:hypothetical protein
VSRPRVPRRDANHAAIVRTFEAMGCTVLDVSSLPGEALDLIVGCCGIDARIEIKDDAQPPSKRKLTSSETVTFDSWRGRAPVVVSSVDDAMRVVYLLRAEGRQA